MTDLEISKALALAIGWKDADFMPYPTHLVIYKKRHFARRFDYRDWNVIGPIAERFDAFPRMITQAHWSACAGFNTSAYGNTPQKAIALAVIGAKK